MPSRLVPDITPAMRELLFSGGERGARPRPRARERVDERRNGRAELGQALGAQRRGVGHRPRRHGIARLAGDPELVVQVRAGGPARHAHEADRVALQDAGACLEVLGELRHVPVHRRVIALVLDVDDVAVAVLPARELDHAVGRHAHRRALGRRVIHALVLAPVLEDRVEARHREPGRDAGELHGGAQEGVARVAADVAVIAAVAVGVAPVERAMRRAAVDEFRREDAAGAGDLAVDVAHLVHDGETVPALHVVIEVDLAREDVGERRDHAIGNPRGIGGAEQRGLDLARAQRRADLLGRDDALGPECIVGALDDQPLAGAGEEAQRDEVTLFVGRDLHRTARLQLVERARRGIGPQVLHRVRVVDAGAGEQAAERVAALHALFTPIDPGLLVAGDDRRRQSALDDARRHGFEHGVRRGAEGRYRSQAEDRQRGVLPRMCGGSRV
jgi:hypothetical protein